MAALDTSGAPDSDWGRLTAMLDEDPEVAAAVLAAPAGRWEVLLDSLDDAGALACLDVADTGDLLVDAISALPRVARVPRDRLDLRPVSDVDDLAEAFAGANALLSAVGIALIALDEADDDDECVPLVAVPAATVGEVERLLSVVGHPALPGITAR